MAQKQKFPHLLGSKWTACESTFGWRHFQVVNRKNEASWVFAEMESSCDRTVKFWINAQVLKDGRRWLPGWKTLEELGLAKTQEEIRAKKLAVAPNAEAVSPDSMPNLM